MVELKTRFSKGPFLGIIPLFFNEMKKRKKVYFEHDKDLGKGVYY